MITLLKNKTTHFRFSLLNLLFSICLSFVSILGTILIDNIRYLILLPISFMFFISWLLAFLIIFDEIPSSEKFNAFISVEVSSTAFALLLIPIAFFIIV